MTIPERPHWQGPNPRAESARRALLLAYEAQPLVVPAGHLQLAQPNLVQTHLPWASGYVDVDLLVARDRDSEFIISELGEQVCRAMIVEGLTGAMSRSLSRTNETKA